MKVKQSYLFKFVYLDTYKQKCRTVQRVQP